MFRVRAAVFRAAPEPVSYTHLDVYKRQNEGKVADVFGPGMYKLTTQTLPVLTYLKNWDKLFESPFKSDVIFFSTRLQLGRRWGTAQPVTLRDSEFGMVRLRAFGVYSYQITDPAKFYREISGTRDVLSLIHI